MKRNPFRVLPVWTTVVTLVVCLVSLPATAQFNDFSGADNDRWFNDLNWSLGHVPISTEDATISALSAYAYTGEGATLQCNLLYVGAHYGPGAASLYSELPIETASELYVGSADPNAGHFVGNLTVAGADVSVAEDLWIAQTKGSDRSGEGHVTITDGSLLANYIRIANIRTGGGDATGSLSVTNGDIISGDSIYISSAVTGPGFSDASLRLENGRLESSYAVEIGSENSSSGAMTLIRAEAYVDYDVLFGNLNSTSLLTLDNAFLEAGWYEFHGASTTQLHVDGVQRVSAGNVNGPDQYSAMDLSDIYGTQYGAYIYPGATLELHFGYTPSVGDSFDLIKLKVGQTFNVGTFTHVVPVDLGSSFAITDEIVPGDTVNGEIVRVTVVDALFRDGFESGDTSVWSATVGGS
jgi:hypothetical protein